MTQFSISNLSYSYGDREIFRDVSAALSSGEVLWINGANGSGKTTLLRTLAGLLRAESGQLQWQGDSEAAPDKKLPPESFCYVADTPALHPRLSVAENLAWSLDGQLRELQINSELSGCGLENHAHRWTGTLSRGQQQRVSLLRAKLCQRLLWLMDEPLARLDADGQRWFLNTLKAHLNAGGLAVISTPQVPKDFSWATQKHLQLG